MKTRYGSLVVVATTAALVLWLLPSRAGFSEEKGDGTERAWSFDKDSVGSLPKGWKVAETGGQGKLATWQVVADQSAPSKPNVVAITKNQNYGHTFNLLIAEDTEYKDLEIKLNVKAVTGEEDQGGGPIWRAKDADNYYIARWNPLEDNFRVYFVKDGRRKQLGTASVKTDPAVWHEIEIQDQGNKIEAKFDGATLIELEDSTFPEAGMVGLWTKANAATAFDDFEVEAERGDEQAWSFEEVEPGGLPGGWKIEATTRSPLPLATWQVTRDASAPDGENVLTLTSPNHTARGAYNLCWTDKVRFKDGEIEVKLRGNTGEIDQGGGPIWRVKDKDNYYICRANPLESNLRVYYVKDGRRRQLATADVEVSTGTWHEIAIKHEGAHIECFFNGNKLLEVDDDTFPEAGGVGLWTKADAATSFDEFEVGLGIDDDDDDDDGQ